MSQEEPQPWSMLTGAPLESAAESPEKEIKEAPSECPAKPIEEAEWSPQENAGEASTHDTRLSPNKQAIEATSPVSGQVSEDVGPTSSSKAEKLDAHLSPDKQATMTTSTDSGRVSEAVEPTSSSKAEKLDAAGVTRMDYRDTCSEGSEDEEVLPIAHDSAVLTECEDSDAEFERILELCRKNREKAENFFDDEDKPRTRENERTFDAEYYALPELENLQIHVDEDVALKKFGVVQKIIDFIVNVKPESDVPPLDLDTVIFDKERNSVGRIFEIFGQVESPMYALRFNTPEDATKLPVGTELYYAPESEAMTKKIFTLDLMNQKYSDTAFDSGASGDDEAMFSDDEEERRYYAKKKGNNHAVLWNGGDTGPPQRGGKKRRRLDNNGGQFGGRGRGGGFRGGRGAQWNPMPRTFQMPLPGVQRGVMYRPPQGRGRGGTRGGGSNQHFAPNMAAARVIPGQAWTFSNAPPTQPMPEDTRFVQRQDK